MSLSAPPVQKRRKVLGAVGNGQTPLNHEKTFFTVSADLSAKREKSRKDSKAMCRRRQPQTETRSHVIAAPQHHLKIIVGIATVVVALPPTWRRLSFQTARPWPLWPGGCWECQ